MMKSSSCSVIERLDESLESTDGEDSGGHVYELSDEQADVEDGVLFEQQFTELPPGRASLSVREMAFGEVAECLSTGKRES
jgi:hypothetical protein